MTAHKKPSEKVFRRLEGTGHDIGNCLFNAPARLSSSRVSRQSASCHGEYLRRGRSEVQRERIRERGGRGRGRARERGKFFSQQHTGVPRATPWCATHEVRNAVQLQRLQKGQTRRKRYWHDLRTTCHVMELAIKDFQY